MERRKKKSRKIRGRSTGRGEGDRTRGAGNRGGRGKAGLGKRAKHRKTMGTGDYGKHGFSSVKQRAGLHPRVINANQIDKMSNNLISKKLAIKSDKGIEINLEKLGYDKILGKGKVINKLIITTRYFSKSAKEKIEKAGGQIIVK